MADPQNQHTPPPSTNGKTRLPVQKIRFPNPPDPSNPDPETLREQWRYAMRQYSKASSMAWGTVILTGLSFFAIGWLVKGGNPLPDRHDDSPPHRNDAPR